MSRASYMQTSFLGGEWSKTMQGRADRPDYRTAMNLCRNSLPIEEGAWTRRPGTMQAGATRNGAAGVLREFHFNQARPYTMELTDGYLRFRSGTALATEDEVTVSAVADADVTVAISRSWVVGDQVVFRLVGAPAGSFADIAYLLYPKQWRITAVAGDTFTIEDTLLNNFETGRVTLGSNVLKMSKVHEFVTPYTGTLWADTRVTQDEENAIIFQGTVRPQVVDVEVEATDDTLALFSFEPATFVDGPYLDPPEDGSYLTPSGLTGTITLTETGSYVEFVSTDVGRLIRLLSEPEDWAAGSYVEDDVVKFNGAYYRCVNATDTQPDLSIEDWAIDVTAAAWTWGTIVSVLGPTSVSVTLAEEDPLGVRAGGDLLYSLPITTWRLGLYSDTTGWPTCGTFHEGRLWMGSEVGNRIDGGMSNRTFDFSPTARDGTVADNNAIAAVFKATDRNRPFWLVPDSRGIICGTQGGEWLVRASDLNDPLTPTSIQVHRETDFGCENVQALLAPLSKLFVQRGGRRLIELTAAAGPSKFFQGQDLSLQAKHFCAPGIVEIAYQKELTPVVWAACTDGSLIGTTYRRDAQIASEPVTFNGWHKHALGTGRAVVSVQAGPSVGGDKDTLNLLTRDDDTEWHFVELLTDIFQEDDSIVDAWHLDGAANPVGADVIVDGDDTFIRYYGLDYSVGETLTAWIGGIDAGDFVVQSDGTIDVPVGAPGSLLTLAYLASLEGGDYRYTTSAYSGGGSEAAYTMEAKENYPAATATYLAANNGFQKYTWMDMPTMARSYDAVRREMVWGGFVYHTGALATDNMLLNPTGFTLFGGSDGFGVHWLIEDDENIDQSAQWTFTTFRKNMDTGVVTAYPAYSADITVPNGIGPGGGDGTSDGTWRLMVVEQDGGGNIPGLSDPYTGNFWVHTQSCELYCLRRELDYAQDILPLFPLVSATTHVLPMAMNEDWVLIMESTGNTTEAFLRVTPREYTTAETTGFYLLSYQDFELPTTTWAGSYNCAAAPDGNFYLIHMTDTGSDPFKLLKLVPPAAGGSYPASDGVLSDVTPWGSVGPNASTGAYTDRIKSDKSAAFARNHILQLRDDEKLAILTLLTQTDGGASLRMDCTYFDIASEAYTTHAGFVKTYMTEDWVATTDANEAAFEVDGGARVRPVSPHLDMHDYDFSVDYQDRWLVFSCWKVVAGETQATYLSVFVNYRFDPAAAPEVIRVISEEGTWDPEYPDYATAIGTTEIVANSLSTQFWWNSNGTPPIGLDPGIFDPSTNAFWFCGRSNADGVGEGNLFQLDAAFTYRADITNVVPPLLRLSFGAPSGTTYLAPTSIGKTFTSDAQIVRPIDAREAGTYEGPASGKTRRTHHFAAHMLNTQGIKFGTDFSKLRPARLRTAGGTDYTLLQLYSGTHTDSIEDGYSLDSMVCWRISRPYPATVLSIAPSLATQDR